MIKIIYKVESKNLNICSCDVEGDLIIRLNKDMFRVYFQADREFIRDYMIKADNSKIIVDLWLVYGIPKIIDFKEKHHPTEEEKCGGLFRGEVIEIINDYEFRLDCGLVIDVDSEVELNDSIKVGDYIQVSGTYQIYFPNTKYSRLD